MRFWSTYPIGIAPGPAGAAEEPAEECEEEDEPASRTAMDPTDICKSVRACAASASSRMDGARPTSSGAEGAAGEGLGSGGHGGGGGVGMGMGMVAPCLLRCGRRARRRGRRAVLCRSALGAKRGWVD